MPSYGAELREAHASVRRDWTEFHGMLFRGGALAPAGKSQPVFHAGSYLTSWWREYQCCTGRRARVTTFVEATLVEAARNGCKTLPWQVRVLVDSGWVVDRDGEWNGCWLFVGCKDLIT